MGKVIYLMDYYNKVKKEKHREKILEIMLGSKDLFEFYNNIKE